MVPRLPGSWMVSKASVILPFVSICKVCFLFSKIASTLWAVDKDDIFVSSKSFTSVIEISFHIETDLSCSCIQVSKAKISLHTNFRLTNRSITTFGPSAINKPSSSLCFLCSKLWIYLVCVLLNIVVFNILCLLTH